MHHATCQNAARSCQFEWSGQAANGAARKSTWHERGRAVAASRDACRQPAAGGANISSEKGKGATQQRQATQAAGGRHKQDGTTRNKGQLAKVNQLARAPLTGDARHGTASNCQPQAVAALPAGAAAAGSASRAAPTARLVVTAAARWLTSARAFVSVAFTPWTFACAASTWVSCAAPAAFSFVRNDDDAPATALRSSRSRKTAWRRGRSQANARCEGKALRNSHTLCGGRCRARTHPARRLRRPALRRLVAPRLSLPLPCLFLLAGREMHVKCGAGAPTSDGHVRIASLCTTQRQWVRRTRPDRHVLPCQRCCRAWRCGASGWRRKPTRRKRCACCCD